MVTFINIILVDMVLISDKDLDKIRLLIVAVQKQSSNGVLRSSLLERFLKVSRKNNHSRLHF